MYSYFFNIINKYKKYNKSSINEKSKNLTNTNNNNNNNNVMINVNRLFYNINNKK